MAEGVGDAMCIDDVAYDRVEEDATQEEGTIIIPEKVVGATYGQEAQNWYAAAEKELKLRMNASQRPRLRNYRA